MEKENQNQQTYQTKPYKSAEKIIFVDSGIRDFLVYGGKALYGTIATLFRVPTFIRKCANNQTWMQRELVDAPGLSTGAQIGCASGIFCGCLFDLAFVGYTVAEFNKKNYLPLAVWAGTNLLSGAYELGRFSKSRKERLEVKARKEAERLQEAAEEVKRTGDNLKSEVNKCL